MGMLSKGYLDLFGILSEAYGELMGRDFCGELSWSSWGAWGQLMGSLGELMGSLWGAFGELMGSLWGAYWQLLESFLGVYRKFIRVVMGSLIKTYFARIENISSRFCIYGFFWIFDPQCKFPCFIGVVEEGLSEFSRRNLTEILITLFMKSIRQAGEGQSRLGQGRAEQAMGSCMQQCGMQYTWPGVRCALNWLQNPIYSLVFGPSRCVHFAFGDVTLKTLHQH